MKKNVWTTKDGRELLISEMETGHIRNAIALVERKIEAHVKKALKIADSLYSKGEGRSAEEFLDQGMKIANGETSLQLQFLRKELKNVKNEM